MLRYAPHLLKKTIGQKNFTKKNFKKNFRKFSVNFISNFILLSWFHSQFGVCLQKLGPLIWEEIETAQTVHKPKLKFIYYMSR
jgi:hypothetical protein